MPIQSLQLLGRPQLRYCLLFDRSGSQRKRWDQHLDDAKTLLGSVQIGHDYGLLTAFNEDAYLDAEGTDPQKLVHVLSKIDARHGTALYDAVIACSNSIADSASPSELSVMFILSDGDDNASHHSREQALQSLLKSGTRVYAIAQKNTDDPRWQHTAATGINALKEFSEKTGGKAYISKGNYDVQAIANDIFGQLSSVFAVSLSPASLVSGDFVHEVEFKCRASSVSLSAPREFYFSPR